MAHHKVEVKEQSVPLVAPNEFLKIPRLVFKLIGVNISEQPLTERNFTFGPIHFASIFCLSTTVIGAVICPVVAKINGTGDFRQNVFISFCVMYLVLATSLWFKLQTSQSDLTAMVNKFGRCFPCTRAEQEKYKVAEWTNRSELWMKNFALFQISAVQLFNSSSVEYTLKALFNEHRWRIDFVYNLWYPFDPYQRGVFELCQIHQFACSIFTIVNVLAFDLLMCGFTEQLCMHFNHLQSVLKELNSSEIDKRAEQTLVGKYVEKHNLIFE